MDNHDNNEFERHFDSLDVDHLTCRMLEVTGSDGVPRIRLRCNEDGGAHIAVMDMNGRYRATIAAGPSGNPIVSIHDHDAELRAVLGVVGGEQAGGDFGFAFFDAAGEKRFKFTLDGDDLVVGAAGRDGRMAYWRVPTAPKMEDTDNG